MVGIYLVNISNSDVNVRHRIRIRDWFGEEIVGKYGVHQFREHDNIKGHDNFAKRSEIIDALVDGTLTIEVMLKPIGDTSLSAEPFIPDNPLSSNILKKFMDEQSADVVFEVSSGTEVTENSSGKRARTTTTFHAHNLILADGAPTLAELCRRPNSDGENATAVAISNVRPGIFRHLLYYVYGGKLLEDDFKDGAKQIIDAADKYGAVNLKLEAEAYYVKSTTFTKENILDNLLYADAMNCALLKEASMDFMVKNKDDIIGKISFENLPSSMISDLLTAMARTETVDEEDIDASNNYNRVRVGTLRKMLHEKGLDVDGSRETLISRLQESCGSND